MTRREIANKVYAAESNWLGTLRAHAEETRDFPGIAPVYIRGFLEGTSAKRAELLELIIASLAL